MKGVELASVPGAVKIDNYLTTALRASGRKREDFSAANLRGCETSHRLDEEVLCTSSDFTGWY
jgi:hypothetical protein